MSTDRAFLLRCVAQTYAWGKHGLDSEVAKLLQCGDESFQLDQKLTYAELWMGTHPKGPSRIVDTNEALSNWIEKNSGCLGDRVQAVFPVIGQLPFLFKVLSVNIALSIQVHPNKLEAERLHKENPLEYPDDNHKPEMAIALTPFQALCGFRPKLEIVDFLRQVPQFYALIGDELSSALFKCLDTDLEKSALALRNCFSALMTAPDSQIKHQLDLLVKRIESDKHSGMDTNYCLGDLLLRLHNQFPGDVGCFCIYFMNLITLNVGQGMFLEANLPHAYLSGDCLECMACSDNVVRAGLTPKFKDVKTLLNILNYRSVSVKDTVFNSCADAADPNVQVYDPPVQDFTVSRTAIPAEMEKYSIFPMNGASIIIFIAGKALGTTSNGSEICLKRGSILFISAQESVILSVKSLKEGMIFFRAYCVLS